MQIAPCPCGAEPTYRDCCGRLHAGALADSAAALMRSRYSAYVLGKERYLLATWHSSTRPAALDLHDSQVMATRWLGLRLLAHAGEGEHATVEFIARFKVGGGSAQRLHEVSRFVREAGQWFYLDGDFREASA